MRKDVKFGLAIGGVLVVTLLVFVLATHHGKTKPQDVTLQLPQNSDNSAAPAPTDAQTPPAAQESAPQPKPTDASADAHPQSLFEPGKAPATQPTASAGDPWDNAVNNGVVETVRTITPDPRLPGAPPADAAQGDANPVMADNSGSHPAAPGGDAVVADPGRRDVTMDDSQAHPGPQTMVDPVPATQPVAAGLRTHRIQPGESFYTISRAVYGDSKYFNQIAAANPNVNPSRLKVGMVITLPSIKDNRPASSADTSATSDGTSGATAASGRPHTARQAEIDPTKEYRVQTGDTLERISRKLYGKSTEWEKIYEANKSAIGSDPARLKLDMILKLPEAPVASTESHASTDNR